MGDPGRTPLPRNAVMWHPQLARTEGQRRALKDLETQSAVGDKELDEDVDVHELGSTTILRGRSDGVGHLATASQGDRAREAVL